MALAAVAAILVTACSASPAPMVGLGSPAGSYRHDDGAAGRAVDILPAGENGLVSAPALHTFGSTGARPANSVDQVAPYNNLIYGTSRLNDASLSDFYLDESFGVRPGDVVRTEHPDRSQRVVIYRDRHDIPHIYAASMDALAFGAGYAGAEDRLFLMDVLRHYGRGRLMSFVGDSCDYETMDDQAIMSKGYTQSDLQAQLDAMPARFGALGRQLVSEIGSYVAGVNAYIARAISDSSMMPVEYAATHSDPQKWTPTDVVAVSTLIALEATGGGAEVQNAALLEYLQSRYGAAVARAIFDALKEQNDPRAPTVIGTRFPYMIPSSVDPSLTALPDNAPTSLGGLAGTPPALTAGCTGGVSRQVQASGGTSTSGLAQQLAQASTPAQSNAVVVAASHSTDGHPLAVFGPELGYYDPEILMQEDLHAPGYDAAGAAFPGANFAVELGRGTDYAWSATTASTDQVDMRIEKLCDPGGGTPPALGTYYEFKGRCTAMTAHTFTDTWSAAGSGSAAKPGTETHTGSGGGAVTGALGGTSIARTVHYTVHGVVQGWSTVGGQPVAVVRQDATTGHDLDQFVGYLRFGMPSLSSTPQGWMRGAADIAYTFNWFYLDTRHIAYYVSGRDPLRDPHADPNLPTWGTGVAEWRGWLGFGEHPHALDPKSGYLVSWNNKPAPGFSASDELYAWGPVFRSQLLTDGLTESLKAHRGRVTRAQLAAMVEDAATQDLDAYAVVNPLLHFVGPGLNGSTSTAVDEMVGQLQSWSAAGFHRRKSAAADTEYSHAAAVAIWDEVYPRIVRALFDPVFAAGGVDTYAGLSDGYSVVPMRFAETPNDMGLHDGDGFYSGWEGYVVAALDNLTRSPEGGLPPALATHLCGSASDGVTSAAALQSPADSCRSAILAAFGEAATALTGANGGSAIVATWTQDTNTATEAAASGTPETVPLFDEIRFQTAGAIPLPAMDWVNRPTYQQVVEFPRKAGP